MSNSALYALTVLIWGSTWFAVDLQLGVVAPEVSLVYRYAAASALLFAWSRFRGLSLRFSLREHAWFFLLGVLLFGANYIIVYRAQIHITSALTAIAFSSMVWMNIINARIFFGTRVPGRTYAGAGLGLTGIVILFWPEVQDVSLSDGVLIGALFSISGALFASFGNIASQAAQHHRIPVMPANAWGMLYGALLNAGLAIAQDKPFNFDPSPGYVISLAFLAVFGSVIAFAAYLHLLGQIGMERVGYAAVMVPIVALVISALFEGLQLEAHIYVGVSLALLGNIFILARR